MKNLKSIPSLAIAAFAVLLLFSSYSENKIVPNRISKNSAIRNNDTVWNRLSRIDPDYLKLLRRSKELPDKEKTALKSLYLDSIWNDGLVRWAGFPSDVRRYDWLLWITRNQPRFYEEKLGEINIKGREKWIREYEKMEQDYLAFVKLKDKKQAIRDTIGLYVLKLQGDFEVEKDIFQTSGRKINLKQYENRIANTARRAHGTDFWIPFLQSIEVIVSNTKYLGIKDDKEVLDFLKVLKRQKVPSLSSWIIGKEQMLKLKRLPFDFNFKTYDGKQYDISQKRGKVILVDFWATWCGTCIAKMPSIKKVHDKYKDMGFEVLSISINKPSEALLVLQIEKKLGTNWPLCIIGGSPLKNEIWSKFGFTSVPQLLLLDKDGKLIEYNGGLFEKSTLEKLVKSALDKV